MVALARVAAGLGMDPSALLDLRAEASVDELRALAAERVSALDHAGLVTLLRLLDAVVTTR